MERRHVCIAICTRSSQSVFRRCDAYPGSTYSSQAITFLLWHKAQLAFQPLGPARRDGLITRLLPVPIPRNFHEPGFHLYAKSRLRLQQSPATAQAMYKN